LSQPNAGGIWLAQSRILLSSLILLLYFANLILALNRNYFTKGAKGNNSPLNRPEFVDINVGGGSSSEEKMKMMKKTTDLGFLYL
jgi:hypothetical protein